MDSHQMFPHDRTRRTLLEQAEFVLGWLDTHAPLNNSCRIHRLCRTVMKNADTLANVGDHGYDELVQAFKDVQEYCFLVEVLGEELTRCPYSERLIRSAKDAVIPAPEDADDKTAGRNAQFELFIAAIARRAGFDVDDPGSADWLLRTPVLRHALEAKRIGSLRGLGDHVSKAAKQIRRTGCGGIIVVDISRAVSDHPKLDHFVDDDTLRNAAQARGQALFTNILPHIDQRRTGTPATAIILHDHVIRPAGRSPEGTITPWGLHGSWDTYHFDPDKTDARRRSEEVVGLFTTALPNW